MFLRIDIERAKSKMSIKDLARATGIKYDTLLTKLNGKTEFTRIEMLKIQSVFKEKIALEELFSITNDLKSA